VIKPYPGFSKPFILVGRYFIALAMLCTALSLHAQEINSQTLQTSATDKMELLTEEGSKNSFIIHYRYGEDGKFLSQKVIYHGPVEVFFAEALKAAPQWLEPAIALKRKPDHLVVIIGNHPYLVTNNDEFLALPNELFSGFTARDLYDYQIGAVHKKLADNTMFQGYLGIIQKNSGNQYFALNTVTGKAIATQLNTIENRTLLAILPEGSVKITDGKDRTFATMNSTRFERVYHADIAEALTAQVSSLNQMRSAAVSELKSKQIRGELNQYEAFLKNRIIEQDKVIQGLVDIRRSAMALGEEAVGQNIYLGGLPGTGKDTTAEADIDALNNKVGAFEQHLFRTPIIRSEADLNVLLGSQTGYVGSEGLSAIVRFVVLHSGGEYKIVENDEAKSGESKIWVEKNKNWKPGEVLPGYFSPSSAGVFLNEVHDWKRIGLNGFFKEFAEKGIVPINNPGKGLSRIVFRGRKYIASNDLIQLCSSLEPDGKRFGNGPMNYEDMLSMWEKVNENKAKLIETLRAAEGEDHHPRYSPEVLNRLSPSSTFLMKPISPEGLRKIVDMQLSDLLKRIQTSPKEFPILQEGLKNTTFKITPALLEYIQKYDYSAEEMARPIKDKITILFKNPLSEAIVNGLLRTDDSKPSTLVFDMRENANKTANLVFTRIGAEDTAPTETSVLIKNTEKNIPADPMSVERLRKLKQLKQELGKHVFGADEAIERVAAALLNMEEQKNGPDGGKSTTFLFAGLTSTGKTELAKAIGRVYLNDENAVHLTDFSNINSMEEMKKAIADIGKALDRGKRIFLLDEIINSNPEFLKQLYPLLREKEMQFADGRKSLKGVIAILTGNLGSEWFKGVPMSVPRYQKIMAYRQIFRASVNNPGKIQQTMQNAGFTTALIARIGGNVFFFDPHYFQSIRQLTQSKLKSAINSLKAQPGTWGWNIQFASEDDLQKTIEAIEDEGFVVEQQGASIDNYINEGFSKRLRTLLLSNEVPSGSTIKVSYAKQNASKRGERDYLSSTLLIETEKGPLTLETQGRIQEKELRDRKSDEVLTAAHEAGHSILMHALFPGRSKSTRISNLPGVAQMGRDDEFIAYAGIASWEDLERTPMQKSVVLRHMATFLGGEVAQTLVSRGAKHDAGKSNDTERAARLAEMAILRWGLSEKWGRGAIPQGTSMSEYFLSLPDAQKTLYYKEFNQMFVEARSIARRMLLLNYDSVFIPMTVQLSETKEMNEKDLADFYAAHPVLSEEKAGPIALLKSLSIRSLSARFSKFFPSKDPISAELLPGIPVPKKMATNESVIAAAKSAEIAKVQMDPALRAVTSGTVKPSAHDLQVRSGLLCESLFH
jgi:ATP-dependent Clp protease ATP-binding subunit ClpA